MRREENRHEWNRGADRKPRREGEKNYHREDRSEDRERGKNYHRGDRSDNRDRRKYHKENMDDNRNRKSYRRGDRDDFKDRDRRDRDCKPYKRGEKRENRGKRAWDEYKKEEQWANKRPRIMRSKDGKRYRDENADERRTLRMSKNQIQPKDNSEEMRLNKYIASAGICSRREADVLISTGVISVNGEVITTLGYKVKKGDVVKYNGRELKNERKVYILLNKPKGFITTSDDPQQRKTVMQLVDGACSERIYPVGRLDRNTTGLLLLTNDGEMTKRLTHPSHGAQKVYNVELDKPVKKEDFDSLLSGIDLEDGKSCVDDINYLNNVPIDRKKVGVSIHSGKNRVIRRMFEALGYEVKKLDRVYFAGLTKKNLQRGQWRFLDDKEIGFLCMEAGK